MTNKYRKLLVPSLPNQPYIYGADAFGMRSVKGITVEVDVYDFLTAFEVTSAPLAHAVKKIVFAGKRGAKSVEQDLDEAIQAIQRAKDFLPGESP